jgi:hypothetical protein
MINSSLEIVHGPSSSAFLNPDTWLKVITKTLSSRYLQEIPFAGHQIHPTDCSMASPFTFLSVSNFATALGGRSTPPEPAHDPILMAFFSYFDSYILSSIPATPSISTATGKPTTLSGDPNERVDTR